MRLSSTRNFERAQLAPAGFSPMPQRWEIAELSLDEIRRMARQDLVQVVASCLPDHAEPAQSQPQSWPDDRVLRGWVSKMRRTCRNQGY